MSHASLIVQCEWAIISFRCTHLTSSLFNRTLRNMVDNYKRYIELYILFRIMLVFGIIVWGWWLEFRSLFLFVWLILINILSICLAPCSCLRKQFELSEFCSWKLQIKFRKGGYFPFFAMWIGNILEKLHSLNEFYAQSADGYFEKDWKFTKSFFEVWILDTKVMSKPSTIGIWGVCFQRLVIKFGDF